MMPDSKDFREDAIRELREIRDEVVDLATDRDIYWRFEREVVQRNRRLLTIRSAFLEMLRGTYVDSATMRVRRLIDKDQRTISLRRLLVQLARYPDLIEGKLGVEALNRDAAELDSVGDKIKNYVDQHVAHHDRMQTALVPTHRDLNDAIDTVIRLLKKYYGVLAGGDIDVIVSYLEEPLAVFHFPWIEPDADRNDGGHPRDGLR